MTVGELIENFALFDNWEDRYQYIIELGKKLPDLPAEFKNDVYRVRGCVSQAWLIRDEQAAKTGRIVFFSRQRCIHCPRTYCDFNDHLQRQNTGRNKIHQHGRNFS